MSAFNAFLTPETSWAQRILPTTAPKHPHHPLSLRPSGRSSHHRTLHSSLPAQPEPLQGTLRLHRRVRPLIPNNKLPKQIHTLLINTQSHNINTPPLHRARKPHSHHGAIPGPTSQGEQHVHGSLVFAQQAHRSTKLSLSRQRGGLQALDVLSMRGFCVAEATTQTEDAGVGVVCLCACALEVCFQTRDGGDVAGDFDIFRRCEAVQVRVFEAV
jgi:hypothetical protein